MNTITTNRSAVCWCGQDLAQLQHRHCPRCGTEQRQSAGAQRPVSAARSVWLQDEQARR